MGNKLSHALEKNAKVHAEVQQLLRAVARAVPKKG